MLKGEPVFNPETCTLLININGKAPGLELEKIASFKEQGFVEKDELHVTIVGFRLGKLIQEIAEKNKDNDVISAISQLRRDTNWTFEARPQLYSISKEYPDG